MSNVKLRLSQSQDNIWLNVLLVWIQEGDNSEFWKGNKTKERKWDDELSKPTQAMGEMLSPKLSQTSIICFCFKLLNKTNKVTRPLQLSELWNCWNIEPWAWHMVTGTLSLGHQHLEPINFSIFPFCKPRTGHREKFSWKTFISFSDCCPVK